MSWVILNPDAMCLHCPHAMRLHRLDTPRDGSTPSVVCGVEGCGCKRCNVVLTDPTPAAPDPQPACECKSCRAKRAYGYALGCCPEWLSHGATCICGGTFRAAPDQAEGPDENRGDDVPSVTSRAEESVIDKGVFRYDTDKTRLGAPPAPWDPSHREIL